MRGPKYSMCCVFAGPFTNMAGPLEKAAPCVLKSCAKDTMYWKDDTHESWLFSNGVAGRGSRWLSARRRNAAAHNCWVAAGRIARAGGRSLNRMQQV